MDGNTVLRWSVIALAMFGVYWLLNGHKSGDDVQDVPQERYVDAPGFAPDVLDVEPGHLAPEPPPPGELCTVSGNRYEADLSSRGAGLTHLRLTDARYAQSAGADMSTTPDHERWRNLRTLFRKAGSAPSAEDQVKYDRFDWKL